MTTEAPAAASKIEHWRRRMSLATGCVLFLFLITHLLNHTLGLASLAAMDAGRFWFLGFWRSVPGSVLFYSSLILHTALAMYGLFNRRSLRMPLWEAAQIVLGLSIPLFMISHVVGTRLAHEWFGTVDTYERLMYLYWERSPDVGLKQTIFLLIAWTHACVGLHYWLRLKPWYSEVVPGVSVRHGAGGGLILGGLQPGRPRGGEALVGRGVAARDAQPHRDAEPRAEGRTPPRARRALVGLSGSGRAGVRSAGERAVRGSGCERRSASPMRAVARPSRRWAPRCWRRAAPRIYRMPPSAGDAGGAPPAG